MQQICGKTDSLNELGRNLLLTRHLSGYDSDAFPRQAFDLIVQQREFNEDFELSTTSWSLVCQRDASALIPGLS